MLAPTLPV